MAEVISDFIEPENAGFDESCCRSSIGKEDSFLKEREPSVGEAVIFEMRNEKAGQIVFNKQMALKNAAKRIGDVPDAVELEL